MSRSSAPRRAPRLNPKLAMLAAGRVLRHCATYLAFDPKGPDDEYVSVLPLPWIMEQVYVLGKGLLCRMKINFVEQPDTMMNDFREIAPTFVLFAPRVWESIAADVRAGVMDSSPLKQSLYELGMKTGLSALAQGKHSTIADIAAVSRASRPARLYPAALGRDRRRGARSRYLQILPGHGRAAAHAVRPDRDCSGAYTLHPVGQVDPDTTGVAMADNIEIRIDNPDIHGVGEIVVRHPNMFLGYYKNPEASAADMKDGWMHSGDAGYFNDNKQLVVIDRIKDLAETARGERFSPQYIENKLKFSPYIAEDRGARRRPRRARGDDLHPLLDHLEMGGEEPDRVHHLHRPRLAAGSLRAAAQGSRNRQRHAAAGAAYFALPAALQGARRRRRRTDPHAKSPPQRHQREIRRHHRRDLSRQARHSRRYRDPLPGRHHPAHPHHARVVDLRRALRRPRNEADIRVPVLRPLPLGERASPPATNRSGCADMTAINICRNSPSPTDCRVTLPQGRG